MLARAAYPRTFKVIHIEVSQQMNPGRQADDFDMPPAVVGHKCLLARRDQQVEGVVIAPALARDELRSLGCGRRTQRIETQKPARAQSRIILQRAIAPIKE